MTCTLTKQLLFVVYLVNCCFAAQRCSQCCLNGCEFVCENAIIPDAVSCLQGCHILDVQYANGSKVDKGNQLMVNQTTEQPSIGFNTDCRSYHLLAMVDLDVPSRETPVNRSLIHWMVGNICRSEVTMGQLLVEYRNPRPSAGSGLHRYTFFLFKQQGELYFDQPFISSENIQDRTKFDTQEFAKKYRLGCPVAVNFFFAGHEEGVL